MDLHIVTTEAAALTDNPDLLHELLRSVIVEGLAHYHEWGELSPFQRLTVHVTGPEGERYKLVSYEAHAEPDAPAEQLGMPGL